MTSRRAVRGAARALRSGSSMLLLLCALTAPVHAQDMTLERVHNLIAAGRFTEATNTLAQWERTSGDARSGATSADRARAQFLRGVLSTDAKAAEAAYISVVLSYPSAPVAPQALLRLGQGLVSAGEARRAVAYLERLRSDYPGARERDTGLLWLARAHQAAGSPAAACAVAREAAATADPNVRTLAELERERACGATATPARTEPALPDTARATTQPPRVTATRTDAATPAGNYAVQSAAFSVRTSAEAVAAKLGAKGFDVRVVLLEGSTLHHVRVGQYSSATGASTVAQRVRQAGFEAIIVNDVKKERRR